MCTYSMIMDGWRDTLPDRHPYIQPYTGPTTWPPVVINTPAGPTQQEFDALKREVEELKKLLKAAKEFDEATGQRDCEQEEKLALLKRIAKMVGVDISNVLPENK